MSDFMLYRGDCLEIMPTLAAGSVDMVLCDLPYGTTACKWDSVIPFEPLWEQYRRIAKKNATIVLTASQPFTTALISSNMREFRYCWVWDKVNRYTGALNANRMPMKRHEDVAVFYRSLPTYNKQLRRGKPYSVKRTGGHGSHVGSVDAEVVRTGSSDGLHNPCTVLEIRADNKLESGLHPTQKPVALMEYLIRTYTNEGETVLDNCMGSGTTGVACMQSGRNFIGIELNEYAQAAALRILKAWGGDTMRTIYATPYNDETKQATGPSTDSGFTTVAEVVEAMGSDWLSCSGRAVVYPGVMFSDYEVAL